MSFARQSLLLGCAGFFFGISAAITAIGAEAERNVANVRTPPRPARLAVNAPTTISSTIPAGDSAERLQARQALPSGTWGQVSGDLVNVRSGPGATFDVVVTLRGGDYFRAQARMGNWIEIDWPSVAPAWVSKDLTSAEGVITAEKVRIRSAGNLNAPILSEGKRGERLEVLGEAGGWYKVKAPAGAKAFIHGKYAVMGVRPPAGGDAEIPSVSAPAAPAVNSILQLPNQPAAGKINAPEPAIEKSEKVEAKPAATRAAEVRTPSVVNQLPVIEGPSNRAAQLEPEREVKAAASKPPVPEAPAKTATAIPMPPTLSAPALAVSSKPSVPAKPAAPVAELPKPPLTQRLTEAPQSETKKIPEQAPAVAAAPSLPVPATTQQTPQKVSAVVQPLTIPEIVTPAKPAETKDAYGDLLPPPRQGTEPAIQSTSSSGQSQERGEVREGGLLYKTRDAFAMSGRVLASTPSKVAHSASSTYAAVKPKVTETASKVASATVETAQDAGQFIGSKVNQGYTKTKDVMLGKTKPHEQAAGPEQSSTAAPAAASLVSNPSPATGVPAAEERKPVEVQGAAKSVNTPPSPSPAPTPTPTAVPMPAEVVPPPPSAAPAPSTSLPNRFKSNSTLPKPISAAPHAERLPVARSTRLRSYSKQSMETAVGILEPELVAPIEGANYRLLKGGITTHYLLSDIPDDLDAYLGHRVEVVGATLQISDDSTKRLLLVSAVRDLP